MKTAQNKRMEYTMAILIFVIVVSMLSYLFVHATGKSVFSVKQQELRSLAILVLEYDLDNGKPPQNIADRGSWCVVGEYYGKKKCLGELERDGYLESLPVSPDDNAYYYDSKKNVIYTGTPLGNEKNIDPQNICTQQNGEKFWCYKI